MALRIEDLTVGYAREKPVLQNISLSVRAGEILAVIGPNGCGKSTLLRTLIGLLEPHSGGIFLNRKNIREYHPRERAQNIAMLAQSLAGSEEMSALEAVSLGRTPFLAHYGALTPRDEEIVQNAMKQTDTLQFQSRKLSELSGGEKQRVLLARALAQQPKVLLLDEPVSNLDIRYQFEVLEMVFRLARREQIAVLLVLHQINLAAALADTILLMTSGGSPRALGPPQEVMTRENLEAVYHVPLEIAVHPRSGRPQARADWVFKD